MTLTLLTTHKGRDTNVGTNPTEFQGPDTRIFTLSLVEVLFVRSSSVKKNVINIFQFSIFTSDEIKTNSVM